MSEFGCCVQCLVILKQKNETTFMHSELYSICLASHSQTILFKSYVTHEYGYIETLVFLNLYYHSLCSQSESSFKQSHKFF